MKSHIKILDINTVNEIASYWNNDDFKALLRTFDFPDVEKINENELKEMLFMAITDFEPEEAAQALLTYKLGDVLNEGQIQAISHEMLKDKVAEEYRDPKLHYDLFNINQLLFMAFNGTFPNTEASILEIELTNLPEVSSDPEELNEIVTKLLSACLKEQSLIHRLYSDQITNEVPFVDAANFIWTLTKGDNNTYELLTSNYWIEKSDIKQSEHEGVVEFYDGHED